MVTLATVTGCSSIKSTMVQRDESNTHWEKQRCLKGVPITLKVPTHLKVYVFDQHFIEKVDVGDRSVIRASKIDVPLRDYSAEIVKTDKIFTVDFKRPGAGPNNVKLEMDNQAIKKIQHDVTDETFKKVAGLIDGITLKKGILGDPNIKTKGGGEAIQSQDGTKKVVQLREVKSLVAVGFFEIDSPMFEEEVQEFLNCHLNKAHDAFVAPPGTKSINRVGLSPNHQLPGKSFCPKLGTGCTCEQCRN